MSELKTKEALQAAAAKAVADVTITDIHTHLFPPNHGDLLLWGIDEMLTYHYLMAELFTDPLGLPSSVTRPSSSA